MAFKTLLILIFLQFGRPQDFIPFLFPFRLALLFTMLTLLFTIFDKGSNGFFNSLKLKESRLFAIFYIIMIVGIPFAIHRGVAFEHVILQYLANVLFFFLLVINVESLKKFKIVLYTIFFATFFMAVMSFLQGESRYGRFYPGTMYDPNDLAYFLVSLLPIFLIPIQDAKKTVVRLGSLAGLLLSTAMILLTGSRGGLIGLGVVAFFMLSSKSVIKSKMLRILLIVLSGVLFVFNADKLDTERLSSITELSDDYNVTSETGRISLWKRGLRLTAENVLTGVGTGCFPKAIAEQRTAEGEIPKWQAAHNSYVQIAAELGVFGFFVFILLLTTCLFNYWHLSRQTSSANPNNRAANIPGLCMAGFCGHMVCAFFLTQGYSTLFVSYFALSAICRNLFELNNEDRA